MSEMVLGIATHQWPGWLECVSSWYSHRDITKVLPSHVVFGKEILPAYQECLEKTKEPILAYIHDDVRILEYDWNRRVFLEFLDSAVGMVGFTGAKGHGTADLYTSPYHLPNLARQEFMSNLTDAEQHGVRCLGVHDVAVCDGLAIFIRRSILENAGGWPVGSPLAYHLYSEWLSCEVHRQGFRIRFVGIHCEHIGGQTSTLAAVKENYEEAHRYFYDTNRDVLPYRVA